MSTLRGHSRPDARRKTKIVAYPSRAYHDCSCADSPIVTTVGMSWQPPLRWKQKLAD